MLAYYIGFLVHSGRLPLLMNLCARIKKSKVVSGSQRIEQFDNPLAPNMLTANFCFTFAEGALLGHREAKKETMSSKTDKILKPLPKTEEKMQLIGQAAFDKLLKRAATPHAQKPAPKHH